MKTIVVIGSSNTDMIVQTPHIPKPGETILGGTFNTAAGGKGANQAVACARAGGKVTFVARVGSDMFGDQALQGFKQDGIDVTYVTKDPSAPSGVALI
ncbi:MAG: ribokinase, partial [Phycisphaeraceae bacterium]|nr:ribokinase [Phycisphaeraceae bacterium]